MPSRVSLHTSGVLIVKFHSIQTQMPLKTKRQGNDNMRLMGNLLEKQRIPRNIDIFPTAFTHSIQSFAAIRERKIALLLSGFYSWQQYRESKKVY